MDTKEGDEKTQGRWEWRVGSCPASVGNGENGAAAFQSQERPHRQVEEKQKRIELLEKKVQTKDEVLAELTAEHIALKKVLGNSDRELGAA